jgi:hypothetical protein
MRIISPILKVLAIAFAMLILLYGCMLARGIQPGGYVPPRPEDISSGICLILLGVLLGVPILLLLFLEGRWERTSKTEPTTIDRSKATQTSPFKSKRAWLAALAALGIGAALFILVEIAFQAGKGKGWTTYTEANSDLANSQVSALALDEQGKAWVGTSRGLSVPHVDVRVAQPAYLHQTLVVLRTVTRTALALLVVGLIL